MKIIHQVVLVFTLFLLLTWGVGSYSIKVSEKALKSSIDQETAAHASNLMHSIDRIVYNRIDIFREYTRDLIFQESIKKANLQYSSAKKSDDSEKESDMLSEELEEKIEYYEDVYKYPVFFEVIVVDIMGHKITHAGKELEHRSIPDEWWKDTKERKIVSYDVASDPDLNISYLEVAFPVFTEEKEQLGAVLLSLNIHDIVQPISSAHHTGKHKKHSTMSYILADKHRNILFSNAASDTGKSAVEHLGHIHSHDIVEKGEESDAYLIRALSEGYMEYEGDKWTLSVSHNLKEIYLPIQDMRNAIMISIILVSIMVLLGILIVSRTVIRPLQILRVTAEKIGKGDLSVKIDTSLKGDVGELLNTFNWMTKEIKKSKGYLLDEIETRKRAQSRLEENEEKLRTITDSAKDAIIMIDNNGEIIFCNPSTTTLFGYAQDELIGQKLHRLLAYEQYFEAYGKKFKKFQETGESEVIGKTVELTAKRKDSQHFPIELSLAAVKNKGLWHAIGIARDVTERKESEMEIKKREEMMLAQSRQAAMGDMIAMIAHQWRQPLTTIGMVANNIMLDLELDNKINEEALIERMDIVSKQTQHLSKTIDDFRNFFKPNKSKEKVVVADVLKNTLEIMGKSLQNNNIALESDIDETLTSNIYANELMQVFINILNNAKDAIKINSIKDGTIHIGIHKKKEAIQIDICDNAGGIPEKVMKRLGEPYFTTKETSGTGLGLYMSKTIVEKHLDGILLWENKNDGACFSIILSSLEEKP